ncbi:MAG: hypothetical protein Faunusvirus33_4 [Faunusvirus sp.]|jgi:hypothetical protein|uniref:Uncharacterized protein n=1 Tax=Faunusvirus sp. TaxID=2487766 RepID=A0A3G4ZXS7_9VIRU|nr:MAG: hypothetical protein Faunusvirus33_4 [Faunusvirus sp.]
MFSLVVVSSVTLALRVYERNKIAIKRAHHENEKWRRIQKNAQIRASKYRQLPSKSYYGYCTMLN